MIEKELKTAETGQGLESNRTDLKESLSFENSRMAAERTLMAWVRTSLSMISFGFTIYKFLQVMQQQGTAQVLNPDTPRNVGLTLIGIGTFALTIACLQHLRYIRHLDLRLHGKPWDIALLVGILIALLGFLMFWSIVLNAGPFN